MENPILYSVVPVMKAILELVAALCVAIGLLRTLWLAWHNRAQLNDPDVTTSYRRIWTLSSVGEVGKISPHPPDRY
jgi:uncharacterized membrane protein